MRFTLSFFFVISFLFMYSGVLTVKKSDKKENIVVWAVPSLFISFFFLAIAMSVINLVGIPVNLISGGILCLFVGCVFWYFAGFNKKRQVFFFSFTDLISSLVIVFVALYYGFSQFGSSLVPIYETSDPAQHIQMAMNVVNTGNLSKLFFAPLMNSFAIRIASFAVPVIKFYKVFIIADMAFFALSGVSFYSLAASKTDSLIKKIFAAILTVLYMLGYPLNNMVFGFCYLGISISIISVIIFILSKYENDNANNLFYELALMGACLSLAMSYILFAPAVFIGVFIIIARKCTRNHGLFSLFHITKQLKVFLVPSLLSIYYFGVRGESTPLTALGTEGYIYRDLISNFLFLIFPVIAFLMSSIADKKLSISAVFLSLFGLYSFATFVLMYKGIISTYYFYKASYVLWFLCFYIAFEFADSFEKGKLYMPVCYLLTVIMLFCISESKIEQKLQTKNPNINNRTAVWDLFDIYHFNTTRIFNPNNAERTVDFSKRLELYQYVLNCCSPDNDVYLVDNWLNVYWYEAITNQRFSKYLWVNPDDFSKFYNSCEYAVIIKDSEEYTDNLELFGTELNKVFENEKGFVVKLK